jgi:hypothetical protein
VVYKLTPLQHPDYDEIMLATEKNKKAFNTPRICTGNDWLATLPECRTYRRKRFLAFKWHEVTIILSVLWAITNISQSKLCGPCVSEIGNVQAEQTLKS